MDTKALFIHRWLGSLPPLTIQENLNSEWLDERSLKSKKKEDGNKKKKDGK